MEEQSVARLLAHGRIGADVVCPPLRILAAKAAFCSDSRLLERRLQHLVSDLVPQRSTRPQMRRKTGVQCVGDRASNEAQNHQPAEPHIDAKARPQDTQ